MAFTCPQRNRSSHWKCFLKKCLQNSQDNTCIEHAFLNEIAGLFFFKKKENLTKVFSCEFCKEFQNSFFNRLILATASEEITFFPAKYEFKKLVFQEILKGLTFHELHVLASSCICLFQSLVTRNLVPFYRGTLGYLVKFFIVLSTHANHQHN